MELSTIFLLFVAAIGALLAGASVRYLRVTPGLVRTEFPLPTPNGAPSGMTCGVDGSVWYALPSANRVGRRKTDGTFQEFVVPTSVSDPYGITTGPDGSIWFSENTGNKIGRVQLRPQGDMDGSGNVTAADIYCLINYLFAGGPPPAP